MGRGDCGGMGALRRLRRLRLRASEAPPRSASPGSSVCCRPRSSRRSRLRWATASRASASSSRSRSSPRSALGASAARSTPTSNSSSLPSRRCSGFAVTLIRPALQALLPSLARTPEELIAANGATSTFESLGTLIGPLLAGCARIAGGCRARVRRRRGRASRGRDPRLGSQGRGTGRASLRPTRAPRDSCSRPGFGAIARVPRISPRRLPDRRAVVRPRLPERPDRGRGVSGARRGRRGGRLHDRGARRRRPARCDRSHGARRAPPRGPVRHRARVLGAADRVHRAVARPCVRRSLMLAVVGAANSVEDVAAFTLLQRLIPDRILTRVSRSRLEPGHGRRRARLDRGSCRSSRRSGRGRRSSPSARSCRCSRSRPIGSSSTIDREAVAVPELALVQRVPMFAAALASRRRNGWPRTSPQQSVPRGAGRDPRRRERGPLLHRRRRCARDHRCRDCGQPLDEGDYFGEIALLRDVPRTATVTALVDSSLYVLQRDDFLAAVTGHEAAHAVGHSVAEERLSRTARTVSGRLGPATARPASPTGQVQRVAWRRGRSASRARNASCSLTKGSRSRTCSSTTARSRRCSSRTCATGRSR